MSFSFLLSTSAPANRATLPVKEKVSGEELLELTRMDEIFKNKPAAKEINLKESKEKLEKKEELRYSSYLKEHKSILEEDILKLKKEVNNIDGFFDVRYEERFIRLIMQFHTLRKIIFDQGNLDKNQIESVQLGEDFCYALGDLLMIAIMYSEYDKKARDEKAAGKNDANIMITKLEKTFCEEGVSRNRKFLRDGMSMFTSIFHAKVGKTTLTPKAEEFILQQVREKESRCIIA